MIYDNIARSSAPNDADKGHQVSRHSSPEKTGPPSHVETQEIPKNRINLSPSKGRGLGSTIKSNGKLSRKGSKALSRETLGSRNSKGSKKSKGSLMHSRVEDYVNLEHPTMKQTLALFKEKINESDVSLLMGKVRTKRAENKDLLKKIKEAESMLRNLEVRQERQKTKNKRKSKLYKNKTIDTIRKLAKMPGGKNNSFFIKNLKRQLLKDEVKQKALRQNKISKDLKKKQRRAIEDIIKEGIENEKLKKRLNDALSRFTQKLDDGEIDSHLMDAELDRILDLRKVARLMGMPMFGSDLEDDEIRELYRQKDYRVFRPDDSVVNQSVFIDQDSLEAIDELMVSAKKNHSVNVGRGNRSINKGSRVLKKKGPAKKLRKNILEGDSGNSRFWNNSKIKGLSKKNSKKNSTIKKSSLKGTIKKSRVNNKSSTIKYKTKSGRLYGNKKPSTNKRSKSAIKKSKAPLSKSQYKLINEKKSKIKKSLLISTFGNKNTTKRSQVRKKKKKITPPNAKKKNMSTRSQKTYVDKYEEQKSKREFSKGKYNEMALGFESFKGKNSSIKSKKGGLKVKKKSGFAVKSDSKLTGRTQGVKLYANRLQDKLKGRRRDFEDGSGVQNSSKLWGTSKGKRSKSRKKSKTTGRSKKKGNSQIKLSKKTTLESQLVNESQINEILVDNTFGGGNTSLKNSKMSLLSGQISNKYIDFKKRSKIKKSTAKGKSKNKVYKSNLNKQNKSGYKSKFLSNKKSTKSRSKNSKKPKVIASKKKSKKNLRGKSEDKLTNSDFRKSAMDEDSMISNEAMVTVKNGKIVNGKKSVEKRSRSGSKGSPLRHAKSGSPKRNIQRGGEHSKNRRKENQLVDYSPKSRGGGQGQSTFTFEGKRSKKMILEMNNTGEVIMTEGKISMIGDEEMSQKLAELDEFVRTSAQKEKGKGQGLVVKNSAEWDEALGDVEKQFLKNLKDSSERMINTQKIDLELKKIEELERSFEMEKKKEIQKFQEDRVTIINQERERDFEDQRVEKVVSFGGNRNDNYLVVTRTEQKDYEGGSGGLYFTEAELKKKLQPFDRRNIFCAPEMLFSYTKKEKIQNEVIKTGRSALAMDSDQRIKVINHLVTKIGRTSISLSDEQDSNIFEKSGNGVRRAPYMYVPTAEFNTGSGKKVGVSNEGRELKINSFNFEKDFVDSKSDPTRMTVFGRDRTRDFISYESDDLANDRNFKKYEDEPRPLHVNKGDRSLRKRMEVIIQKLHESGVRDPSMGKPELQKTMRTMESEFNSIPEDFRDSN